MAGPPAEKLEVGFLGAGGGKNAVVAADEGAAGAAEVAVVPPKSPSPGGLAAGVVEPVGVPKSGPAVLGSAGFPKRPPAGAGVEPTFEVWAPNNPPEVGGADVVGVPNIPAEGVEEKPGVPPPYDPPCWGFRV